MCNMSEEEIEELMAEISSERDSEKSEKEEVEKDRPTIEVKTSD